MASITSITFYYILLQFGANLRGNFNTEIKLTAYFIHLILLKMLQIMPYKDKIKAATILWLLGNETIHFNTRGKKSEPDLRKQLNIEVKSTTKLEFFSLNILIYLYILLL